MAEKLFLMSALALSLLAASPAPASEAAPDLATDAPGALVHAEQRLARESRPAPRAALFAEKALALTQLDRLDEADAAIASGKALLRPQDEAARADLLYAQANIELQRQRNLAAEPLVREALALRQKLFGPESGEAAACETMLAKLLISQSKFDEGLPRARHAWEVQSRLLPPGDGDRMDTAFQLAVGLVYARKGAEGEALLRQLLDEMPLLPERNPYRAKVPNMYGTELLVQGRLREAVPWLRQAVDTGERLRTQTVGERADNLSVLGIALLMQDRPEDALPFFDRAAEMFGEAQAIPSQAGAYINAGTAADRAGERARGLALREKGMAMFAALPEQHELGTSLNRFKLAQSYAHAGRLAEAEAMAAQAVETIGRLRPANHYQATNSRISLGWMQALNGRTAQGLDLVKANFRLSVKTSEQLEVSKNQVVGVLDNIEAYSQALQTAMLAGDHAFAFEAMQVMVETDASRAAVAVAERELAGDTALGGLLKRRQEASAALAEADAALTRATGSEEAGSDRAAAQAALAERQAGLAAVEAELDRAFPAFRSMLRPRRLLLEEVRARLAADEALLVIEESDLGLYTMAITRTGLAVGHDPMRRHQVRALVRRVRAGIDSGGSEPFDMAAARALYRAVFTPDVSALIGRNTRLRLATGDILSALPLSLLVSNAAQKPGEARFLIEDHALSIVPSLSVLGDEAAERTRPGRLVAIGAPALTATPPGEGQASRAGGPALADLPGAEREIAAMAQSLKRYGPAQVLTGTAASEAALRALDLRNVGVLLFATHGLVAGAFDARSEPALVLTAGTGKTAAEDGFLTASEAAQLDIDAQWVILSACDTAGGSHPSAAGYTGLARAFLFAGARRVVASHWPVRDDISARLSLGLVDAMQRRKTPDEALRTAILAVMRDRSLPDARNPALWAPFMVVAR